MSYTIPTVNFLTSTNNTEKTEENENKNKGMAVRNLRLFGSIFNYDADTKTESQFADYSLADNLNGFAKRMKRKQADDNGAYLRRSDINRNLFQLLGINSDAYTQKFAREYLDSNDRLYQSDLINADINKNGGVKYSDGDDFIQDAIELAKADIHAIETGTNLNNIMLKSEQEYALEYDDLAAYHHGLGNHSKAIETLNLDDDNSSISALEYACYLLAADGMAIFDQDGNVAIVDKCEMDGVITSEEVQKIADYTDSELQALAKAIYDKIV